MAELRERLALHPFVVATCSAPAAEPGRRYYASIDLHDDLPWQVHQLQLEQAQMELVEVSGMEPSTFEWHFARPMVMS